MKKGFIVLLDVLVALLVSFLLFAIISQYVFNVYTFDNYKYVNIIGYETNVLTVLEKSNLFYDALENNTTNNIRHFLNRTNKNVCAELTVYDSSDNLLFTVRKQNCQLTDSYNVMYRSFIYNNNFYLAKLVAWYK